MRSKNRSFSLLCLWGCPFLGRMAATRMAPSTPTDFMGSNNASLERQTAACCKVPAWRHRTGWFRAGGAWVFKQVRLELPRVTIGFSGFSAQEKTTQTTRERSLQQFYRPGVFNKITASAYLPHQPWEGFIPVPPLRYCHRGYGRSACYRGRCPPLPEGLSRVW